MNREQNRNKRRDVKRNKRRHGMRVSGSSVRLLARIKKEGKP